MRGSNFRRAVVAALVVILAACEPPPPPPPPQLTLTPVDYAELDGWSADDPTAALVAFRRSCAKLSGLPQARAMSPGGIGGTVADWLKVCADAGALADPDAETTRRFFASRFVPHRVGFGDDDQGLFTGYYEAELHGAWQRKPPFTVPLYAPPRDMITADLRLFDPGLAGRRIIGRIKDGQLIPYHNRAEIDAGALAGRNLELLWVDDPIDAFFLQIQGSGRVRMADGRVERVGYASKNGHPYVAIGRPLIERGAIPKEQMSMQAIRRWLADHPAERDAVMNLNPSYVFFRRIDGDGPIGAQGVVLTPGRSLAVDTSLLPLGAPIWLDTTEPLSPETPLRRLVIAQDTGGAIKGAIRGDLFWGHGDDAAAKAGAMKQQGRYYLLLPKPAPTS